MFEWRVNGLGTLFINHISLTLTDIELEPLIHLFLLLLLLLFGDVTVDDDASDDSDGREAAEHAPGYGPRAATDKPRAVYTVFGWGHAVKEAEWSTN